MFRVLSFISIFFLFSCNSKEEIKEDKFYLDVYGDQKLEEIRIKHFLDYDELSVYENENKILLNFNIYPLIVSDLGFRNKTPKIENIYIEGNSIQTPKKGFRIRMRNTDLRPDCFFIDLYFDKYWIVETYGVENTTFENDEDNKSYILTKRVNKKIDSILIGKWLYPYELTSIFKNEINLKNTSSKN